MVKVLEDIGQLMQLAIANDAIILEPIAKLSVKLAVVDQHSDGKPQTHTHTSQI